MSNPPFSLFNKFDAPSPQNIAQRWLARQLLAQPDALRAGPDLRPGPSAADLAQNARSDSRNRLASALESIGLPNVALQTRMFGRTMSNVFPGAREAGRLAARIMDPATDIAMTVPEARDLAREGRYGLAAGSLALAALPIVPGGLGKVARAADAVEPPGAVLRGAEQRRGDWFKRVDYVVSRSAQPGGKWQLTAVEFGPPLRGHPTSATTGLPVAHEFFETADEAILRAQQLRHDAAATMKVAVPRSAPEIRGNLELMPSTTRLVEQATQRGARRTAAPVASAADPVTILPRAGRMQAPNLHLAQTYEELLQRAKAGEHLVAGPSGGITGAPPNVTNRRSLQRMRQQYDEYIDLGAEAMRLDIGGEAPSWYDDARRFVTETSPNSPRARAETAMELGPTSIQNTPYNNLGAGMRARWQRARGQEIRPGMPVHNQGVRSGLEQVAAGNVTPDLGPKIGPYTRNVNPEASFSPVPVNDLWQSRAFGYENDAFTDLQHSFTSAETALATDRLARRGVLGANPSVHNTQEAAWVGIQARRLMDKGMPREQALREAASGYRQAGPDYTVSMTREAVPGTESGHFPGVLNATDAERATFSAGRFPDDAAGRDLLASSESGTNFLTRPSIDAQGLYRNPSGALETNPARVGRPMVPRLLGARRPDDEAMAALRAQSATTGYMMGQNASALHWFLPGGSGSARNAVHFATDARLTGDQLAQLEAVANRHGLIPVPVGDGVRFLPGESSVTGAKFDRLVAGELGDEVRRIVGPAEPTIGNYTFHPDDYKDIFANVPGGPGGGRVTSRVLEMIPEGSQVERMVDVPELRQFAGTTRATNLGLGNQFGGPSELLQNALAALEQGGIPALRRLLAENPSALPALLATAGGAALLRRAGLVGDERREVR